MIKLICIAVFIATVSSNAFAGQLTPNDVWGHIKLHGAVSALHSYFECGKETEGYSLIESGKEEWLKIAVRLLDDADACHGQEIRSSIAHAMLQAPEHVLPLVDRLSPGICIPFQSDDEPDSKHLAYLDQLEKVLRQVKRSDLQRARNICLSELTKTRQLILK